MMARNTNVPFKGRIQKRKTYHLQIITFRLQRAAGPYRSAITGCEQPQQGSRYSITPSVLHLNRRKRIWTRFNSVALKAIRISSRLPARDVPTWEWTRLGCAAAANRESLARVDFSVR
jgi:hypothetical protein